MVIKLTTASYSYNILLTNMEKQAVLEADYQSRIINRTAGHDYSIKIKKGG